MNRFVLLYSLGCIIFALQGVKNDDSIPFFLAVLFATIAMIAWNDKPKVNKPLSSAAVRGGEGEKQG